MATTTRIQHYGTGKRKSSVARVYLRTGKGQILINKRPLEDYFPSDTLKMVVKQPLQLTDRLFPRIRELHQ